MLGCSPTTEGNSPGVHCTKLSSGEADRRMERLTEQSHGPLRRYHRIYVVECICSQFIPTVHAMVLSLGTWSAHFTWSRASSAAVRFTATFCHVHVVVCPSSYIVGPFYFHHWLGSTPCRTALLVFRLSLSPVRTHVTSSIFGQIFMAPSYASCVLPWPSTVTLSVLCAPPSRREGKNEFYQF